jgi:hypothetical protein
MKSAGLCRNGAHFESLNERTEKCSGANCCIAGFMSKCGAGPLLIDQRACRFFRMSSTGGRCMHYCVSLDGHCDSVEAQLEIKTRERSRN